MSNQGSLRPAERSALLKLAPTFRWTRGLSLLALLASILLSFATRAEAYCHLHINMNALPFPHKQIDDATRTVYSAGYKQWVGSACGWGFKPVFVEAAVRGTWDKVKKEATERVDVRVTGALATTRVAR